MGDVKYYADIENYITNKIYPNDLSSNQKTAMRKRVRSYELRTDGLYYKMKGLFLKIILDEPDRLEAIKNAHVINDDDNTDFHLDRVKTFNRLCSEFKVYWKEIVVDIDNYLSNRCKICCNFECDVPKNDLELDRSKNWKKVVVAILGPFRLTTSGNKYINVLVDPESRWIEATPMNGRTSVELATCINNVFLTLGWSLCYYLNMKPEFVREVDKLLVKFGEEFENSCTDINTTFGHETRSIPLFRRSYTVGILTDSGSSFRCVTSMLGELFAKILDKYLSSIDSDVKFHGESWESCLLTTLHQLRQALSDDRGYSPFYAMHNYNPSINANRTVPDNPDSTSEQIDADPFGFESAEMEDLTFTVDQKNSLKTYSRINKKQINSFDSFETNRNHQTEDVVENITLDGNTSSAKEIIDAIDSSETVIVCQSVEEIATEDNIVIVADVPNETYDPSVLRSGSKRKLTTDGDSDNINHISKKLMSPDDSNIYLSEIDSLTLDSTNSQSGGTSMQCPFCFNIITCWSDLQKQGCSQSDKHVCVSQVPELKERRKCSCCNKFFTKTQCISYNNNNSQPKLQTSSFNEDFSCRCNYCDFKTKVKNDFDDHIRNHREKGFPCGLCSQVFKTFSSLSTHAKIHNTNRLASKCEQCGVQMASPDALLQHVKCLHETANRLPSQVCREVGKNMNLSSKFTVRCKGKPFKCDQCEYSCKSESALQNHEQLFHNETDRQYTCTVCPYRSQTSEQLREHFNSRHKQDSSRFTCQFCAMKFKTMTTLQHHLHVHTGQHLYNCQVCDFSAKSRQTLNNHNKIKHPSRVCTDSIEETSVATISCLLANDSCPVTENRESFEENNSIIKDIDCAAIAIDALDNTKETLLLVVDDLGETMEEIVFCTNETV